MAVVSVPGESGVRRMDPLFRMAVVNGIRAVVETNIRKGADLDARDERGKTLLMLAAARGHSAICRLLLDAGADPVLRDSDGRDAAAHAAENKRNDAYLVIAERCTKPVPPEPEPVHAPVTSMVVKAVAGGFAEPARPLVLDARSPLVAPFTQPERPAAGDSEPPISSPSGWEIAADPERPDQDLYALATAAAESFDISLGRARSDGEDWSATRIDLPAASPRSAAPIDLVFEPTRRQQIGRLLLQGLRTAQVHPSQIASAAAGHAEAPLLSHLLSAVLEDLGADICTDSPKSGSGNDRPTYDERLVIREAIEAIAVEVADGTDGLRRLRVDLDRWSLLDREDEVIYGRQIQEGFEDALNIASRSETVLAGIVDGCERVLARDLPPSELIDFDDDVSGPSDEDADSTETEVDSSLSIRDLPEPLAQLQEKLEQIKVRLSSLRSAGSSAIDPLTARRIGGVLAECEFTSKFLRSLAELAPTSEREAKLLDEYRRALWRMDYARERMVLSNMRLVIWHARKYRATSHLSLGDLVQEGALGLMKAAFKFDPSRGFKFATYGLWWIRQSITRAIADTDRTIRIPVHAYEHYRKLRRQVANGAEFSSLSIEAVAENLQIPRRQAGSIIGTFFDAEMVGGLDDVAAISGDEAAAENPESLLDRKELRDEIVDLLNELDPRQRDVVCRRFGLRDGNDQTLEEIGQVYGVTRERIRQIEAKAMQFLAHPTRTRRLQAFLR